MGLSVDSLRLLGVVSQKTKDERATGGTGSRNETPLFQKELYCFGFDRIMSACLRRNQTKNP
jgi:hypothetical protein